MELYTVKTKKSKNEYSHFNIKYTDVDIDWRVVNRSYERDLDYSGIISGYELQGDKLPNFEVAKNYIDGLFERLELDQLQQYLSRSRDESIVFEKVSLPIRAEDIKPDIPIERSDISNGQSLTRGKLNIWNRQDYNLAFAVVGEYDLTSATKEASPFDNLRPVYY